MLVAVGLLLSLDDHSQGRPGWMGPWQPELDFSLQISAPQMCQA